MATPKRARATSSTSRSKKSNASNGQETTTLPQSKGNVEDVIRYRAYELYQQRGRNDGFDLEDWLRAEHEVTGRVSQSA
jgi:Protein of unknown function (DUF2934)